jgi:hypothetical protein
MFYSQGHLMFLFPHQEENDLMVIQYVFFLLKSKHSKKNIGVLKIGLFKRLLDV